MNEIKNIHTEYNGYFFRSRTEARWAVFFDALGIEYRYEHQDYLLDNGARYLPDFWLPEMDAFVEVKYKFDYVEKEKCRQLCILTGRKVIMLEDVPDFKGFYYFYTKDYKLICGNKECISKEMNVVELCAELNHDCYAKAINSLDAGEDVGIFYLAEKRIWVGAYDVCGFGLKFDPNLWEDYTVGVMASRRARFEFNGQ